MTVRIDQPLVAGEVPEALQYQFLDDDGDAINLTGYTATFRRRERSDPTGDTIAATVSDAATGTVRTNANYVGTAGIWFGEFSVTNGTNTFVSDRIVWVVRAAIPVA